MKSLKAKPSIPGNSEPVWCHRCCIRIDNCIAGEVIEIDEETVNDHVVVCVDAQCVACAVL